MPSRPIILVSAVTPELESARLLVAETLRACGAEVRTDEYRLQPPVSWHSGLTRLIERVDAVVQLIGHLHGESILLPEDGSQPPSRVEYEAHYARQLGKPVFSFLLSRDYPADPAPEEPQLHQQQQGLYRQRARSDTPAAIEICDQKQLTDHLGRIVRQLAGEAVTPLPASTPAPLSEPTPPAPAPATEGEPKKIRIRKRRVILKDPPKPSYTLPVTILAIIVLATGAWYLRRIARGDNRTPKENYGQGDAEAISVLPPAPPGETTEMPSDLASLLTLAQTRLAQGKYPEAELQWRRVLALRKALLGTPIEELIDAQENLGAALQSQGKHREAELQYRSLLTFQQRELPADHPDLFRTQTHLAQVLHAQGQNPEALTLARQAEEGTQRVLGPDSAPHRAARELRQTILSTLAPQ